MSDEVPEALGSACYITKEGDVDLQVVLKVIAKYNMHFLISLNSHAFCYLGDTLRCFAG